MKGNFMKNRVVSFHYTLKNKTGETLDSSRDSDPMTYLEGSGQIIPGLEEQLKNLKTGEKKQIVVPSDRAYGPHDQSLVMEVPRTQMPQNQNIQVGDQFSTGSDHEGSPVFTATKVTDTHVTLDGNHPMAGQDLYFDVEVTETRDATAEEEEHGHAHGPGVHGHGEHGGHGHGHGNGHHH